MNNKWGCQFNGRIYKVSNASINRMLRVLRYRGIDLVAYSGKLGFTLITEYPVLSRRDGYNWSICLWNSERL